MLVPDDGPAVRNAAGARTSPNPTHCMNARLLLIDDDARLSAMVGDYLFGVAGLHRMEINIRPENAASLAVVRKLDMREEGLRVRFLHIAGEWRDHRSFAITADEIAPAGLVGRLRR